MPLEVRHRAHDVGLEKGYLVFENLAGEREGVVDFGSKQIEKLKLD